MERAICLMAMKRLLESEDAALQAVRRSTRGRGATGAMPSAPPAPPTTVHRNGVSGGGSGSAR